VQLSAKSMALSSLAYNTSTDKNQAHFESKWLQDLNIRHYKIWCGSIDDAGTSVGAEAVTGTIEDVSEDLMGEIPFLAFRGTESPSDMIADIQSILIREFRSELLNGGLIGQAGKGYIDHLDTLKKEGLADEVIRLASRNDNRLLICGHSLGGAMATLMGSELHRFDPELRLYVVTFGAPRVFLKSSAQIVNKYQYTNLRFINEGDLVPTLGNVLHLRLEEN
jgi:hypothetical protein